MSCDQSTPRPCLTLEALPFLVLSCPVTTLGAFLTPEGFAPPPASSVLREARVVRETLRYVVRARTDRRARRAGPISETAPRSPEPVILVPGFMAGDPTLTWLASRLRAEGHRAYRSHIHANVGCTRLAASLLESRIEALAIKRESRVRIVGHSLGGLLGRGLAARRPDLVSQVVTMGSPLLAPGAHHISLTAMVEMLNRLSRAGVPGVMGQECVAGPCAQASFDEARQPLPDGVLLTSIWSPLDGIVDPRSCIDPEGEAVEVRTSHVGMAVDPLTHDEVVAALSRTRPTSTPAAC